MDAAGSRSVLHCYPVSIGCLLLFCRIILQHEAGAAAIAAGISAAGMTRTGSNAAARPLQLCGEGYAEAII